MKAYFSLLIVCLVFSKSMGFNDSLLIEKYQLRASILYEENENYDSIMFYLNEIEFISIENQMWNSYLFSLIAGCNISNILGDFEAVKCFAKRSFFEGDKLLDKNHEYHSSILNNLSAYYEYIGENEKAITYMTNAVVLMENRPKNSEQFYYYILGLLNLGTLYSKIGDTDKAASYYFRVLSLSEDSLGTSRFVDQCVASSLYAIGLKNFTIGDYMGAVFYYNKSLEFIEELEKEDLTTIIENRISLANAYRKLGQWEDCLNSLNEAHVYQDRYKREKGTSYKETHYYNVKAKYLADKDLFDESISSSLYAIDLSIKLNPNLMKDPNLGDLIRTIGDTYYKKRDWALALEYYHKALNQYSSIELNESDFYECAPHENFKVLSQYLLQILSGKINGFNMLYQLEKDPKPLITAHQHSLLLIQLADRFRQQIQTQGSQLYVSTELKPAYEQAIKIALKLYELTKDEDYLQEAFKISEKSKAVLLSYALNNTHAKYQAGLPDSLLGAERELNASIIFFQKQIFQEENKISDQVNPRIKQWERKLFQLQRDKEAFDKNLAKNHPQYFQFKNQNEEIEIEMLQKSLNNDDCLIEYFAGDSALYIFTLTNHQLSYKIIESPKELYLRVRTLASSLSDPDRLYLPTSDFKEESYKLYSLLIGEHAEGFSKYLIVPDGVLGYLSFEVLLTNLDAEKNVRSLPYLLKTSRIQYAYSAQLLFNDPLQRESVQAKNSWGGFAPEFKGEKQLFYNTQEIKDIQALMKGQAFIGSEASLDRFTDTASYFRILHLATHGYADIEKPQFSKLEFTSKDTSASEILYAQELLNLKLNAELVVLSSCETGLGPVAKGEGIMSLAWAFRYAGVPGILMSLWKAESSVSKKIMLRFYHHLNLGASKSEAIRLAKIDYLKYPVPGRTHPKYWANFILIGDDAPIEKPLDTIFIYLLVIFSLVSLTGYALVRRKQLSV